MLSTFIDLFSILSHPGYTFSREAGSSAQENYCPENESCPGNFFRVGLLQGWMEVNSNVVIKLLIIVIIFYSLTMWCTVETVLAVLRYFTVCNAPKDDDDSRF